MRQALEKERVRFIKASWISRSKELERTRPSRPGYESESIRGSAVCPNKIKELRNTDEQCPLSSWAGPVPF